MAEFSEVSVLVLWEILSLSNYYVITQVMRFRILHEKTSAQSQAVRHSASHLVLLRMEVIPVIYCNHSETSKDEEDVMGTRCRTLVPTTYFEESFHD